MNLYAIPLLISAIILWTFAIFIVLKGNKTIVPITLACVCIAAGIWLFTFSFMYQGSTEKAALFWARLGYIGVIFMPVIFYHFTVTFLNVRNYRRSLIPIYLGGVIFILFIPSAYFISGIRQYYFGKFLKAGIFHPIFILFFYGVYLRCLYLLFRRYRESLKNPTLESMRVKYIFWAFAFASFATHDFLPDYGIEFYPISYIFAIGCISVITYAIIKHQLMDINIAIKKGLVYSVLAGFITAVFFALMLIIEEFFQDMMGYQTLFITAGVGFLLALGFNPMKDIFQRFVDRRFFRGTLEEIATENIRLHEELLKQDRMKAVATLAASMAHEIKNPLTIIKTFSEYLPDKYNDKSFIDKFTLLVKPEVEKINLTVQQLLNFSKPSVPDLKPVNICQILHETLELLSSDFIRTKIRAEARLQHDTAMISADSNQLRQVFLNLFLNSIDAMPNGGTITVSDQLIGNPHDKFVEIAIEDTGCGISKEDLKRIFRPFFTTKSTGTGLGLSVVHDILEQHGAAIRAESEEGKWTRFVVRFPVIQPGVIA